MTPYLVFGPFRLDPIRKRLWRGEQELALQPRPLAVLQYLVPIRITTKVLYFQGETRLSG